MYVSRHHPVSTNAPLSHGGASSKWSRKQDQKLKQAVQKYGTQWSLISRKYRFDRSVNSLVKRWHGKLKEEVKKGIINNNSESSDKQEEQKQEIEKTKKIRKQQTQQQKLEKPKNRRGGYRRGIRRSMSIPRRHTSRFQQRSRKPSQNDEKEEKNNENQQIKVIDQESEKKEKQENQKNEYQKHDSFEDSDSNFVFQHEWNQHDDMMLKELILVDKILNWQDLASRLKIQTVKQVRKRWQKHIYPLIIESRKIGGCLKYSDEEDAILSRGVKLGMTVGELRKFLPGRTPYSLEARRRRTLKLDEEQVPQLRYWTKKLLAYKFVDKRHQHLEKPTSEDQFMFRSESE